MRAAILTLFLMFPLVGHAADDPLVIGTRIAPPFVVESSPGEYEGISVELWRQIADELDIEYRFEITSLPGLISGLEDGSLDASVAALTVTPERESRIDFSHPFHTSGLAIAVPREPPSAFAGLGRVFSWQFLAALSALAALLFGVGCALWVFERKQNPEMFGGSVAEGLGSSFWWAAVTMTTVGYGDKAPVTLGGRVVGLVWMFAAIILISGFTAAIASSLTVGQLETRVGGPGDLPDVRVVTVAGSSSADYLRSRGIRFDDAPSVKDALDAVARGDADAVVYDAPILRYLSARNEGTRVLPGTFRRQDYAIALPSGSLQRESVNQEILRIIASPEWQEVLSGYLGRD